MKWLIDAVTGIICANIAFVGIMMMIHMIREKRDEKRRR